MVSNCGTTLSVSLLVLMGIAKSKASMVKAEKGSVTTTSAKKT